MKLFTRDKKRAVQSFILNVVNNNCPELKAMMEGPRLESRVNMVVVLMIVPVESKRLQVGRALTAVTKELSSSGVAVVVDQPHELNEVVLGFRVDGQMTFIRAKAKHLSPMGGGFYQLGFRLTEIVSPSDYPALASLGF